MDSGGFRVAETAPAPDLLSTATALFALHYCGESLADIADRQEISLSYLEQLFAKLRRGGLVRSVRGPGGGYLLAREDTETRPRSALH